MTLLDKILQERNDKIKSMFFDIEKQEKKHLFRELDTSSVCAKLIKNKINEICDEFRHFDFVNETLDKFYLNHLLRVTTQVTKNCLALGNLTSEVVLAAFLHNALEKNVYSRSFLKNRFGSFVSESVVTLTQDRKKMEDQGFWDEYYAKLYEQFPQVLTIKICDKYDNVLSQCFTEDDEKRERYFQEIETYLIPKLATHAPKLTASFPVAVDVARNTGFCRFGY